MQIKSKEILIVDIDSLVQNPKNNNKHSKEQIERLAKLIKHHGFRNPLVISNRSGFVIAGHGRIEAAKLAGLKEVPVMRQDFDNEASEYAYLTSDNAIASWSELDMSMVNTEMLNFPDLDIDLLGIKDFELVIPEVFEPLTDEDDVPEVVEPIVKRGDIWLLGNHRLMCGDSTMIDDVEKLMNGEKADMVFTDPPCGVDYKGINNDSRGGLEDLLDGAFGNYLATSKSGASIYVFHSDRCADIFHAFFRRYFHFSSMIIWNKNSLTMSQTDYQSKHEPCMYGWMDNGAHQFFGDRKQLSVWDVFKERVSGHTTPKPVAVIERAIGNSSKGGDLVTDFFMGSGSTIIACEKNQRKSYGLELDPKYCDVIIKRWMNYTGRSDVKLESTGELYNDLEKSRI